MFKCHEIWQPNSAEDFSEVTRYCDILDVTLLRMSHCPLDAGVHSVMVKPTALGFADRASRRSRSSWVCCEV